ncbi:MAG: YceI family protein [Bacteroidota bacterium]
MFFANHIRLNVNILLPIALLSLTAATSAAFSSWNIKQDYQVKFSGKAAEGTFEALQGTIVFDPADLASATMNVSVDVATIDTGNSTKDKHARGSSWFDADAYPKIMFKSSNFRKSDNGYVVRGKLTLHGITKEIEIPFTFTPDASGGLFEGGFSVERKEYGIKGNAFGFLVGKTFDVALKVPVGK